MAAPRDGERVSPTIDLSPYMPAEWEPHGAVWLAWPHHRADWPRRFGPIPYVFAELVRLLSEGGESVRLLVQHEQARDRAADLLERSGVATDGVRFHVVPTDRGWLRDCGPIFVRTGRGRKGELRALDFRFNGWAKYENWRRDDRVAATAAEIAGMRSVRPLRSGGRIVLEGGAIDVDGRGTLLATEECLLSDVQARNPGFTRQDYEAVFEQYLGVERTVWLPRGIVGDDTHGHVDDVARFVGDGTIAAARERRRSDANHGPLEECWRRLRTARLAGGERPELVELPMPGPVVCEGERLPASYANFLVTNRSVIVPVFDDPADRVALDRLSECFPGRDVVGLYARDLVWGLGTVHCLTQQQPAG